MDKATIPPLLSLLIGVLAIGFSAIFVRLADAPGLISSFYRMLIAALVVGGFLAQQRRFPLSDLRGIRFAALAGLFFAADIGFWSTGVVLAGAINPTILTNTTPLWVSMAALLFFKERLTPLFWVGTALAGLGAAAVLGLDALQNVSLGLGSLFGLISGLFYAGYFVFTQLARRTLDVLTSFWWASAASVVGLGVASSVSGFSFFNYDARSWLAFLGAGLITQLLGYIAINHALGHLPASVVSPSMLGQPVITALLALPLLGETVTPWQLVSGVIVLIGVLLVHYAKQQASQAQP